jgi:glyoxylase-like metal-dependent hydrolase (beta-lactamase superfamily II)
MVINIVPITYKGETMPHHIRTIGVGATRVHIINIGDVQEDLNGLLSPTEADRTTHRDLFDQPARLPIQSVLLDTPGAQILVDAGAYDYPPDSPLLIPGYTPPPDLMASLAEIDVGLKAITHVVITHAHGDHFNALTAPEGGGWMPVYPNARHYLGRGDWEKMQAALADPTSLESRTFGVLYERRQLELVENPTDLPGGVTILPAPGESPGHQVVRVHSEGQVLYCIGDLYHVTAEVEQPAWMPPWNDAAANRQSRATLNERFVAEDALLVATHIAEVGRMQRVGDGYTWSSVTW